MFETRVVLLGACLNYLETNSSSGEILKLEFSVKHSDYQRYVEPWSCEREEKGSSGLSTLPSSKDLPSWPEVYPRRCRFAYDAIGSPLLKKS